MNATALFCLAVLAAPLSGGRTNRPVPKLLVGKGFHDALNQPLSAEWKNVRLRDVLLRISEARAIAILVDRRIDPTITTDIEFRRVRLQEAIKRIAGRNQAELSIVGNSLYLGPVSAARKIRTLIRLRQRERIDRSRRLPSRRRLQLAVRKTVRWNDLDRPADLIEKIARRYRLTVNGLDRVPHDLWAGGTLPDATFCQALSLVLIQFDLTFTWTDRLAGIRIIPVPRHVAIEKLYTPRDHSVAVEIRRWRQDIPGIEASAAGQKVLVRGTVEQHEALAALLDPRKLAPRKRRSGSRSAPAGHPEFTLRVKRIPLTAVMKKFEESGFSFQYDSQALRNAGIRLESKISIDIKEATPNELFTTLFKQVGLTVRIEGKTVRLTPQSPLTP